MNDFIFNLFRLKILIFLNPLSFGEKKPKVSDTNAKHRIHGIAFP